MHHYRIEPAGGALVPASAPLPVVAARSSCKHLSLSAPIRFCHWLMPPTARGGVGAVAPEDGVGVAEGACNGVTDGDCDGVTAGVSEGVMLGGVKPAWGWA